MFKGIMHTNYFDYYCDRLNTLFSFMHYYKIDEIFNQFLKKCYQVLLSFYRGTDTGSHVNDGFLDFI